MISKPVIAPYGVVIFMRENIVNPSIPAVNERICLDENVAEKGGSDNPVLPFVYICAGIVKREQGNGYYVVVIYGKERGSALKFGAER